MLIKKNKFESNDVIVLKLNSGTEVVARFVSRDASNCSWTITKPLVAQPVKDEDGIALAFMPFSLTACEDEEFTFAADRLILAPYRANDQVKNSYTQNTSSIQLPPTPKLIT